jgi:hypothetical protein
LDWRPLSRPGVRATSHEGLGITLDGHQEEQTDFLIQWLPLRPSSTYELTIKAQSADIPAGSGLRSKILDASTGTVLAESAISTPVSILRFETFPHSSLGELVLGYQRALGNSRIAGTVAFTSVAMVPVLRR